MKHLTLILCLMVGLATAELITVQVGNTELVLDISQGDTETTLEIILNATDTEVEIGQGDTIKIIQGTQEVIVEVVTGDKDALIEAIQEKPDVHYFVKTEAEGLAILEIWGKPDIAELEKDGYKKVTKEDIHNQGYLTPSESEEIARQQGTIDESKSGYSSWINASYEGNNKKIVAGSKTTRPWHSPGRLFLACTLYKQVAIWWPPYNASTHGYQRNPWGWSHSKTFAPVIYPNTETHGWRQNGWHHWGDPYYMQTSSFYKPW